MMLGGMGCKRENRGYPHICGVHINIREGNFSRISGFSWNFGHL